MDAVVLLNFHSVLFLLFYVYSDSYKLSVTVVCTRLGLPSYLVGRKCLNSVYYMYPLPG